jgi:dTDP-4-dehydrorhamnose 3,5-epimerase-like enzyme
LPEGEYTEMNKNKPFLIDFKVIGEPAIGYISVADFASNHLPFVPKRVYWTYYTPESVVRGRHAHKATEQILIAIAGRIVVNLELPNTNEVLVFSLSSPSQGLYIPPSSWHTMQYSNHAVQLVLSSREYDENDYIRNYQVFKQQ